jgi:hypothetical protein
MLRLFMPYNMLGEVHHRLEQSYVIHFLLWTTYIQINGMFAK